MPAPKRQEAVVSHTSTASDTRYWRLENVEDEKWHSIYVPLSFPLSSFLFSVRRCPSRRSRTTRPCAPSSTRSSTQWSATAPSPGPDPRNIRIWLSTTHFCSIVRMNINYVYLLTRKGFSLSKRFQEIYLIAPYGMVAEICLQNLYDNLTTFLVQLLKGNARYSLFNYSDIRTVSLFSVFRTLSTM